MNRSKHLSQLDLLPKKSYPYTDEPSASLPSILIVEDNEDVREYLGSLIAETYQVTCASNGLDALALLKDQDFDLIVSDIGMPIMDGFEFLKRLRQELNDFTPFLFLTAHTERSELMQALLLGVDAYLTKPFESDEFLARINSLLSNHFKRKEHYAKAAPEVPEPAELQKEEENASFRSRWLKELEDFIQKEIGNSNIRIPDLAFQMAVSERTFRNRIKEFTGLSPNEYLMEVRMTKALRLLEKGVFLSVAEVAHAVGLEYSSYFSKQFKERFGKSPSDYL